MPENLVPKVKRLLGRLSFNTINLSQVLDEARAPDWKPLGLSTDDVQNFPLFLKRLNFFVDKFNNQVCQNRALRSWRSLLLRWQLRGVG